MTKHRYRLQGLIVFSVLSLLICPWLGKQTLQFSHVWQWSDITLLDHQIFWQIRLPRAIIAWSVGAALAISGMAFQAVFRNPLAEPYTLGIASGAALVSSLYIFTGAHFVLLGISGLSVAGILGAMLSSVLVYALSRLRGDFSPIHLLLTGVILGFFCSSLMMLIQYLSDFTQTHRMMRWLIGGIDQADLNTFLHLLPLIAMGLVIVYGYRRELNLLLSGKEVAISRGVAWVSVHSWLFLGIAMMVGSMIAITGPIGFVGLIIPHIARILIGHNHLLLYWGCLFLGGAFLTIADTLSRTIIAPAELPVGILTSLMGAPFFLWLMQYRQKRIH